MGKATEVVKRFYEAFDSKEKGWHDLVTDGISFEAPLPRASGAKEFIALTEQFLQFNPGTKVLKPFEDGIASAPYTHLHSTHRLGVRWRATWSNGRRSPAPRWPASSPTTIHASLQKPSACKVA